MQAHPKLSIVVLCWNSRKVIPACLESLSRQETTFALEVIVVDNASEDGTASYVQQNFPQFKLLQTGSNLGFSRGNNRGIEQAAGDYVLILNPDTELHPNMLEQWITYAETHPEAGAFGCRVLTSNGSLQFAARPFPNPLRYWIAALGLGSFVTRVLGMGVDTYAHWNPDVDRTIDWTAACALLVRANVLKKIGGFDERFFYHFEDVDLCRRIWNTGAMILYAPTPTLKHIGGNAPGRLPIALEIEKCRNRFRYFLKHYGRWGLWSCRCTLVFYAGLRFFYSCLLKVFRQQDVDVRARRDVFLHLLVWSMSGDARIS